MNIEQEIELEKLREKRKFKHLFKAKSKKGEHDPLFEETKYHIIVSDQGYYLKTTIATTATYTRIWRIDLSHHYFYLDNIKYYYTTK